MIRRLIILLLLSLSFGAVTDTDENVYETVPTHQGSTKFKKHNLSFGMLDDRTGISLIGYTYNVRQTDLDEYFIGGGTMIMAFTGTVGWKHYYKKSRLSISSVLCGQYVAHFGFMGLMPTASFTIEYDLVEWAQVKLGGMGLVMLSGDNSGDVGVLPFMGLNFRF